MFFTNTHKSIFVAEMITRTTEWNRWQILVIYSCMAPQIYDDGYISCHVCQSLTRDESVGLCFVWHWGGGEGVTSLYISLCYYLCAFVRMLLRHCEEGNATVSYPNYIQLLSNIIVNNECRMSTGRGKWKFCSAVVSQILMMDPCTSIFLFYKCIPSAQR